MGSVYKAPGVYVTETANPAFVSLPAGARKVGLVATSNSYTIVKNTAITKGSAGGTDTIPGTTASEVLSLTAVGDIPDYDQYVAGTDYVHINNTVDWSLAGSEPTTGATYYVSYHKAKATANGDYDAITFYSVEDVRNQHGDELVTGIVNPMTTAANMLFSNGASVLVCVQASTGSNTDIESAIDKLKAEDVDIVIVPQSTNTTLRNYIKSHVDQQSSQTQRHERMAFITTDGVSDAVATITGWAEAIADERIIITAPPSIDIELEDVTYGTSRTVLLPSIYAGAAIAGIMTNPNYDVAEPITRKQLSGIYRLQTGISGRERKYLETEMNTLGGKGVCVILDDNGTIKVRHGITTDITNVNTNTISVVETRDWVKKRIRTALDSAYIGTKITSGTPASMKKTIESLLDGLVNDVIIVEHKNISVTQNSSEPRQVDVTFAISVVYPCEFIEVSFSLYVA